jgi:N-acetylmuramoyl-L-alanine amidase
MKNPRNISCIVVHCTATAAASTVEAIKRYWNEQRGWDIPGYHYLILRDGTILQLLDEKKTSFGTHAHNAACIHIAYIGGIDKEGKPIDNRSEAQKYALFNKIVELTERYPKAQVTGHGDLSCNHKCCPCFDVKAWLKEYVPSFKSVA